MKSIFRKLLASLLLSALLPLGVAMLDDYRQARLSLSQEIFHRLRAIADSRSQRLENYCQAKRQEIIALAATPTIKQALKAYTEAFRQGGLQGPAYRQAEETYGRLLAAYSEVFGYYDLFLVAANGDIVYTAAKESDLGQNLLDINLGDAQLSGAVFNALTTLTSGFSGLEYYAPSQDVAFFSATPVLADNAVAGVLALQLRKETLFDIVTDYRELGKTGNVQLAMAKDGGALLVAPTRLNVSAAFNESIVNNSSSRRDPLLYALQGDSGDGFDTPDHAEPRLVAWRYIPSLRLGLAVGIDAQEALAPITALQNKMVWTGLAVAFCALLFSRLLAKTIAAPIKQLKAASDAIASGRLTERANVPGSDEIAALGRSFNAMMNKLQRSQDELEREISAQTRLSARLATAEQAALKHQAQLRTIFDHTAEAIVSIDAKGTIVSANAAVEHTFGYLASELTGQNVKTLMPEPFRGQHDGYLANYHQTGAGKVLGRTRELVGQRKNGETFPLELSVRQVDHSDDIAFTALIRDISERKHAETRLRMLSAAMENSPAMVYITDRQGIIEYANPAMCAFSGYGEAELLGTPAGFVDAANKALWSTVLAGNVWRGKYRGFDKQGNKQWAAASLAPILDDAGNISHMVAVAEDITAIMLTQKETERAKEQAVAASRAKSEFLSRMSHELRTPLNAIIGFAQLMDDPDEPLNESQRENIGEISCAGRQLLKMVNEVLELSQLETGASHLHMESLALEEVLADAVSLAESLAEQHAVSLEIHPDCRINRYVAADRQRLTQCLLKLLNDAIVYSPKGATIDLRCSAADDLIHIAITDRGPGMTPDQLRRVFEPFANFDDDEWAAENSGIGLSVTLRYVELMGGRIEAESAPGKGSTFTLVLKVADDNQGG